MKGWKWRTLTHPRISWVALAVFAWLGVMRGTAGEFQIAPPAPSLDRWVYPFGDFLGDRPVAPTFASFDPRFDTRDGQVLLGWDTANQVTTNAGPAQYLIRRLKIAVTVTANNAFVYDPTFDTYLTYATNVPGYVPDGDPGRPVELYGAGYRNGFTAESFRENSSYGRLNPISSDNISIGTRNAFAAMHGTNGTLIDIANNVGQANASWTNAPFEVRPWAVGVTTNAVPGELVPEDSVFVFEVDLRDPQVVGYLQSALNEGRLRLFLASLSPASQVTPGGVGGGGSGAYPQWATRENVLFDPPRLEFEGALVGPDDTDGDGLPDDWERFYFQSLEAGPLDDRDQDGIPAGSEYQAGTDPTSSVSRLEIVSAAYDGDGNATLQFPIAPSRSYRVELSSDLQKWAPATGTLSYPEVGLARFVEQKLNVPPSGPPQAFYRVVAE